MGEPASRISRSALPCGTTGSQVGIWDFHLSQPERLFAYLYTGPPDLPPGPYPPISGCLAERGNGRYTLP
jgi:hypothetical protein